MKVCKFCEQKFDNHLMCANHIRWYHCNNDISNKKNSEAQIKIQEKKLGKFIEIIKTCQFEGCNKKFTILSREFSNVLERKFCSISCSNKNRGSTSKFFTEEIKDRIRKITIERWKNGYLNSSNNKYFSSKGEREMFSILKDQFPHMEWTTGGILKFNNFSIQRDAYTKISRIVVEYDGEWHFRNIGNYNNLYKKQIKDKALREWCLQNNYKLVRISETFWSKQKHKSNFLHKLINKVNDSNIKSIFIGKEYLTV